MGRRLRAGVALGAMALLFGGCAGDDEICDAYACLNGTFWRTTVEVAPTVEVVDVRYCEGSVCRDVSLDVPENMARDCTNAEPASVCVGLRGVQLEVEARWLDDQSAHEPEDGTSYQLVVSDHATGDVLFDETQAAKFEVARDSCHRCWHAQLGDAE